MSAKMYFLAILTPQEVNAKVLEWKYYMREHFGCVVAMRSPAHITLIPPFWMNEELTASLESDAHSFSEQQISFKIELENFDAFRPKVIFLHVKPTEHLDKLRSELESHLLSQEKYPIKRETRPFHPHITIANRDLLRKDFAEAFGHFRKIAYRQSFMANEIVLLKHMGGEWESIQRFCFTNRNS
jgi:2'-5' RNA ligase